MYELTEIFSTLKKNKILLREPVIVRKFTHNVINGASEKYYVDTVRTVLTRRY